MDQPVPPAVPGSPDLPHLLAVAAVGAWCTWFAVDAWSAQRDVENLILIVPVSVAAVVLCAVIAAGCLRRSDARRPLGRGIGLSIAGTMALLAGFAVAGPWLGFDVATFVYIAAMLLLGGERRVAVLLLVPAVFCAVVVYSFGTLLATPLPLLLGGDGG